MAESNQSTTAGSKEITNNTGYPVKGWLQNHEASGIRNQLFSIANGDTQSAPCVTYVEGVSYVEILAFRISANGGDYSLQVSGATEGGETSTELNTNDKFDLEFDPTTGALYFTAHN